MLTNFKISRLKSCWDMLPVSQVLNIAELEKLFTTFIEIPKKKAPAIVSGHFNNGKRRTANLHSKSLLFLDIDYYSCAVSNLELTILNDLKDYRFIAYSTARHLPEKARVRIVLFLEKEVGNVDGSNISDYKVIASNFIDSLGSELKKSIEITSSITPNHFMYLPIIPHDDYVPWYMINPGKSIANDQFMNKNSEKFISSDPLLTATVNTSLNISEDQIISCLHRYKAADCDYHEWREVGQALHHQYKGRIEGFRIWDNWSKADNRPHQYQGSAANEAKWNTFTLNNDNPITFATVLFKVKQKSVQVKHTEYKPISSFKWAHTYGKSFTPLFTEENCHILFKEYNIQIKYDVIKKDNIILFGGKAGEGGNEDMTRLKLLFSMNRIPVKLLPETVDLIGRNNRFNSWKNWIESRPWDGKDRFNDLCETIMVLPEHVRIRDIYIKRWLIQMLHLTCLNDELDPKNSRLVLIFQGKQYIGKSTWLTSLVPVDMKDYVLIGKALNSSNDMDILSCIRKIFVELGEISSSFRKSDMENLKNFISRPVDILNRKYKMEPEVHRRTTVFFGTTNEINFLPDKSGNSRFLILPVIKCNAFHNIDMQQLYAQLLLDAVKISNYNLLEEETILQTMYNKEFESISTLEEKFIDMFKVDSKEFNTIPYTATKVLEELGFNIAQMSSKKRIANEMGAILNKFNFKKSSNPRGWFLPSKRIKHDFEF